MDRTKLYKDIAKRTGGDIYLGVVGPVRTGKSTFIRRFLELLVIPNIEDEYERARVTDELPQSGSGRSVMTTQPKFVPNEAVSINLNEDDERGINARVRMVDCVGFMVPGALGQAEGEEPRMVRTPWFEHDIPFEEAAEIGTRKVIQDHSTVGIMVTTDGSVTDIDRESYIEAEQRVIAELSAQHRPFVIVLNTKNPQSEEALALKAELESKYSRAVVAMDVLNMSANDAGNLIENLLMEFPIRTLNIETPSWMSALGAEHPLNVRVLERLYGILDEISAMKDYRAVLDGLTGLDEFEGAVLLGLVAGSGDINIKLSPTDGVFYRILSEESGYNIADDYALIDALKEFATIKGAYERIRYALDEAERTGYGLVQPSPDEMTLQEPEIVRQGSRFGVRLKANSSGLHIIKVTMESEISPLVGTEEQSEELIEYLLDTFEKQPEEIWKTNIFGKPLYDLVRDEMLSKTTQLPDEVRMRLRDAVQRIVNEGCSNLICIML